jgi:hypothetical protein
MNFEVDIIDNPHELWTAAVEYLSMQRNTREEAEKEATELVQFVTDARKGELANRLENERYEREVEENRIQRELDFHRKQQRKELWSLVGWISFWAFLVALIVTFALSMYWMKENDHAGYDQKQVGQRAAEKLEAWYGHNESQKLANLKLIGKPVRSELAGKEAWLLRFREGKKVLRVFIWETAANNGFAARYER